MLFKELFPIVLGGTGFVGLAGTSSYFLYKHVKTNSIREEINKDLGELRDEVLKLIGKDFKKSKKNPEISLINKKIKELKKKNKKRWKNYTNEIQSILKKYKEIVEKVKNDENITDKKLLEKIENELESS